MFTTDVDEKCIVRLAGAQMAKLNILSIDDSDDDLPCLSDLIGEGAASVTGVRDARKEQTNSPVTAQKQLHPSHLKRANRSQERLHTKQDSGPPKELILPLHSTKNLLGNAYVRESPRRAAKKVIDYSKFVSTVTDTDLSSPEDDDDTTDLSGFIVSDSESLDENIDSFIARPKKRTSLDATQKKVPNTETKRLPFIPTRQNLQVIDLISPTRHVSDSQESCNSHGDNCSGGRPPSRDLSDDLAILRFSPPRSRSPQKLPPGGYDNVVTPPCSPSKSKLNSPSKKLRVPPTPHRPSVDAFWSQEVINDWYDTHSPRKTPKTKRRKQFTILDDSDSDISPCVSPRKSPSKSPSKRDRSAIDKRKAFNDRKQDSATAFLAEVDSIISQGELARLSESTGGIKLIWSNKLNSTAGRANWRRQTKVNKHNGGSVTTTYHHHASIELAEKVIDDEERLLNVIAHEYCHLANFMISGVKNNPHGKEFKQWAAKCTKAFGDRGVEVTTKHTYEISYKYIWVCSSVDCGVEYKRHSKSIDPVKHRCGSCKGTLVQTKPVPRKGFETGKRTEYQDFVKKEYERVKKEQPGAKFGEIMAVLGREFREQKNKGAKMEEQLTVVGKASSEKEDIENVLGDFEGLNLDA